MHGALGVLAEPNRLEILRLVWASERCASDIAAHFKVTFGAISQHLRRLLDAGLVRRRRDGRRLFYAADRQALGPLAAALEAMWADKLNALKTLAEAEQREIDAARRSSRPADPHDKHHRKESA